MGIAGVASAFIDGYRPLCERMAGTVLKLKAQDGKPLVNLVVVDANGCNFGRLVDDGEQSRFLTRQAYFLVNHILELVADFFAGGQGLRA